MTPADVATVLAKIAAYDRRTVGTADVAAWHEILHPYALGEALQAVARHHRDSADWCRPAHLVAHIKTIRAEQTRHTAEPLALPSRYEPDDARQARMDRGMASCRDVIAAISARLRAERDAGPEPSPSEVIRRRALDRAVAERRHARCAR